MQSLHSSEDQSTHFVQIGTTTVHSYSGVTLGAIVPMLAEIVNKVVRSFLGIQVFVSMLHSATSFLCKYVEEVSKTS